MVVLIYKLYYSVVAKYLYIPLSLFKISNLKIEWIKMEINSPYAVDLDLACRYCEENNSPLATLIPRTKRYFDGNYLRTIYTTASSGEQALMQVLMQLGDEKCQPLWAYDILEPHLNEIVKLAPPRKTVDGTPMVYHRHTHDKGARNLSGYQQPLL